MFHANFSGIFLKRASKDRGVTKEPTTKYNGILISAHKLLFLIDHNEHRNNRQNTYLEISLYITPRTPFVKIVRHRLLLQIWAFKSSKATQDELEEAQSSGHIYIN
jgi:hypothetical protein